MLAISWIAFIIFWILCLIDAWQARNTPWAAGMFFIPLVSLLYARHFRDSDSRERAFNFFYSGLIILMGALILLNFEI